MPLTRREMDEWGCSRPGCDHKNDDAVFLHAQCHPHSSLTVCYVKAGGKLVIRCYRCGQLVADVQVAP